MVFHNMEICPCEDGSFFEIFHNRKALSYCQEISRGIRKQDRFKETLLLQFLSELAQGNYVVVNAHIYFCMFNNIELSCQIKKEFSIKGFIDLSNLIEFICLLKEHFDNSLIGRYLIDSGTCFNRRR